jgi:uncharacterized protein (DUF1810 family)
MADLSPLPPIATAPGDAPDLTRFLPPQDDTFADALAEIRAGRKTSHWIWWVFPQLASLGASDRSRFYGLSGLPEARGYLAHPLLGPRLVEALRAILAHRGRPAADILGEVDAKKLWSCATLFAEVEGAPPEARATLDAFFGGEPDARTLALLGHRRPAP